MSSKLFLPLAILTFLANAAFAGESNTPPVFSATMGTLFAPDTQEKKQMEHSLAPLPECAFQSAIAQLSSSPGHLRQVSLGAIPLEFGAAQSETRSPYKTVAALETGRDPFLDTISTTCYPPLSLVTSSIPSATVGSSYSVSLAANGGQPPYTWSFGHSSLQGFSIGSSGDLTGTPAAAGIYVFNVVVSDSLKNTATGALTLTVASTPTPTPTPTPAPTPTPTPSPSTVIVVTPARASITTGTTHQFAASVTGISKTAVTWTVSGTGCGGAACGTISSSGLYTAPAAVPSSAAVTVTATSVAVATQSTAEITIVPPQAAGYSLAWEDTFSKLSLCTSNVPGCNWYNPGLWWQSAAGTITDPSGTYANLEWKNGQANNKSSTNISTTSPNGAYYHAWTYGYFEVSMKFDPTTGSAPAIWMFAEQGITGGPSSISGELDIFEWQSQTPTTFYGTAHVWQNGANIGGNGSTDSWPLPAGTNLANYNTYGLLWTPTSISWYFNNVLMETIDTTSAPYSTVYGGSESYFLILSQQASCKWTYPCSEQVSPLHMQVQWVHVYAPPAK